MRLGAVKYIIPFAFAVNPALVAQDSTLSEILIALVTAMIGIGALLSFNVWGDFKVAGLNLFDLLDYATSKFMLPLAGLGAIVFAAWKLEQQGVRAELGLGRAGFGVWTLLARYVARAHGCDVDKPRNLAKSVTVE